MKVDYSEICDIVIIALIGTLFPFHFMGAIGLLVFPVLLGLMLIGREKAKEERKNSLDG